MSSNRLHEVEEILNRYRKQVSSKEITLTTTPYEDKERIKLQIADLKKDMLPYEQEYWEILSQQSGSIEISEQEAQIAVAEFVEQVGRIEVGSSTYTNEIIILLKEIRDTVNQQNQSAAAKVKGVISSIPPFLGVSYEAELDTETFLRKNFPTFITITDKLDNIIKKKRLP